MADVEVKQANPLTADVDGPNDAELGVYAPFDYSPEPFADLSEEAKGALLDLDSVTDKADVAARRLEVEQCWKACHFDRGYQHLLRDRKGGWVLPGQNIGNGKQAPGSAGGHVVNVYSTAGDKICAALNIETPKIEFFPKHPGYGPDETAAEEAENFKYIWALNNNLEKLQGECARIMWNEDRYLLYTRYVLNGQKYGFEDDDDVPVVPQDEFNPPDSEPTGQSGSDALAEVNGVEAGTEAGETSEEEVTELKTRKARGQEVTTLHGKLDHKVPISVDCMEQMPFIKLYEDVDLAIARATFPWIADKIQPGSDGVSDTELDRIARENVRQAVLGAYVTGDSMQRHCVVKHTWFRPSMFFDPKVSDTVREELLKAFPDGCLMVKAGTEFAYARNENMDDHLVIGHALTGKGQNRRALGSNMIPLQERINDQHDLLDAFARRTVPKKHYNQEAFDIEALKKQSNTPGASGPFQPQPGLTTMDQYIMVEPTPQPQPFLADLTKWYTEGLSEDMSGAVPSLWGAATNTETVGGIKTQINQALQRVGPAWKEFQRTSSEAAKQAAMCAADCRDGKEVTASIPGRGKVTVNCADLKGSITCYPEASPSFPESWAQREDKILMLFDGAKGNPDLQKLMTTPRNLPVLADAIRIKQFHIPGADGVKKQRNELEILLRSGANINPKYAQIKQSLTEAQAEIAQGKQMSPEEQAAIQQGTQMLQTMPPTISTVQVSLDTDDHASEIDALLEWINSNEGQKFRYGNEKMKAAYANVLVHLAEHRAAAKQLADQNAPSPTTKPASVSLSANYKDLPQSVQVQALGEMGMKVNAEDLQGKEKNDLNKEIAKRSIPESINVQKSQQPRTLRR